MTGEKKTFIIKKVIKKGHGGHHGGSWKVAYADFVTALMAFFLVMWLLAISSESGREALADYYNELTLYDAVFNGGLPSNFNDKERPASILDGGCFSPRDKGNETDDSDLDEGQGMSAAQIAALLRSAQEFLENLESLPEGVEGGEGSGDAGHGEAHQTVYAPMTEEQQQFTRELQSEIQSSLGEKAAGQVMMEKVKGGLRIQIIDQDGQPTFRSGGTGLTPEGRAIINLVAQKLAPLPNKISIEGHTDARPFASNRRMTNWELSTARASATRVALAAAGVSADRLTAVSGYADTRPLPDTDPLDSVNRRVSIMIWDQEDSTPPLSAAPDWLQKDPTAPPPPPVVRGDGQSQRPKPESLYKFLNPEEIEQQLIDSVMEKSAAPDLSTVGPASSPSADDNF